MGVAGKTYSITTELKGATKSAQDADTLNKSIVNLGTGIVKTGNSTATATQQFTKLGQTQTALTAPMRAVNTELATQTAALPKTVTGTTQLSGALGTMSKSYEKVRGPQELYNKNLTTIDKTQTTMGSKIKGFGSSMGGLSTNMATLGGTVLNTSRQYADLQDAQIKVDRGTLKLSKANENVTATQAKMNEAIAKFGPNSKEAAAATLNYNQALDQQKLATTLLGEAQEDQQRTFENFWMGIIPTVTSSAGTIMSSISAITGGKGLGGIKSALTGLKGINLGNIASMFTGIGSAASAGGAGLFTFSKGADAAALSSKGLLFTLGKLGGLAGGFLIGEHLKTQWDIAAEANLHAHETFLLFLDAMGLSEGQVGSFDKAVRDVYKTFGADMLPATEKQTEATIDLGKAHDEANKVIRESAMYNLEHAKNTQAVTDAENKLKKAQEDLTKAQRTHNQHDDMAARLAVKKAQAELDAAKATSVNTDQLKEFGKTIAFVNPKTGQFTETVSAAVSPMEALGASVKVLDPLTGKFSGNLATIGPTMENIATNTKALTTHTEGLTLASEEGLETFMKVDPTLSLIAKGYAGLALAEGEEVRHMLYLQTITSERTAKYLADLKKMEEQTQHTYDVLQEQTSKQTGEYVKLARSLDDVIDTTGHSTEELTDYTRVANNNRTTLEGQNAELFKQAAAMGMSIDANKDLALVTGKSDEEIKAQNRTLKENILALSKDTSFLTDATKKQDLLTDARIQGTQSANDWIQSLIKSTEAGKAEDEQILKIATDLLGKGHPALLMATDDLKAYIESLGNTEEALKKIGEAVKGELGKAFSIIDKDSLKEAKKGIKDFLKDIHLGKEQEQIIKIGMEVDAKTVQAIKKEVTQELTGLTLLVKFGVDEAQFDASIGKVIGRLNKELAKGAQVQPIIDLLDKIKSSEGSADLFIKSLSQLTGMSAEAIVTDTDTLVKNLQLVDPAKLDALGISIAASGTAATGAKTPLNEFEQQIVDIQDLNKVMNTHYIEGLNAMGNKTEEFRNFAGSRMDAVANQMIGNMQDINKVMNSHYIGGLNAGGNKTEQFKKVATSNMAQTKSGMVGDIVEINKKLNSHFIAGLNAGGNKSNEFKNTVTKNFNAVGNSARSLISDISELADELADLDGTKSVVTIEHRTVNTTVNQRYGGSHIYDPGYQMGGAFISYQDQYYKGAHISEYNKPELVTVTPLTNPNILDDKEIHIKTENQGLNFERMTQRIVNALKENSVFGHINANLFVNGQQVYNAMRPFQLRRLTTQL